MHNTLRNIFLIARREYLQRVRTKSFIWTTLLIPGLMIGFTLLPGYFMSMKLTEKKHLTVASDDGDLARAFKERFAGKDKESGAQYEIEVVPVATEGERQKLESDVQDKELDGYLWLTRAALQNGKVEYHVRSTGDFMERERIHSAVNFIAIQRRLAGSGVQGVDVDAILKPVTVDAVQVGHGKSNSDAMLMTALLLVLILYMTVILQGVAVMRSVLEEKTSRVMEVLLSAVTPRELMAGKIIGVGSVGLTQIAIWGAISLAVSFTGIATAAAVTGGGMHLTFTSAFFFVVFYLLGFMLYSSLAAALGAPPPPPWPNANTGIATAAAITPASADSRIARRRSGRGSATLSAFSGGNSVWSPSMSSW